MIDKIYLKRHLQRREDLKNEIDRYDMLIKDSQLRGINMDGMPHGSATGDSAFYSTLEKVETERKIKELREIIDREHVGIESVLEKLQYPAERKIIKMRYFQCLDWQEIHKLEFGSRWDYYENLDKYKNKVFKIHGSALKHIKEVQS